MTALLLTILLDLIHFHDGRVWTGEVIEEEATRIKVRLPRGAVWVSREEVARVQSTEALRVEYRERRAKAGEDPEAHRALAAWCRDAGLADEARAEWAEIVRLAPDDEPANLALGRVKHDGKWMTREDAARAQGLVEHEGDWVTPLRAEVLAFLEKSASEDLVERGEAKKAIAALGDAGRAEVEAIGRESLAALEAVFAKENAVSSELQLRAKAERSALVALVSNEERFPAGSATDAAMRQMREGVASLQLLADDPAGAFLLGDPALARTAARVERVDSFLGGPSRLDALRAAFAAKLGDEGVFRAVDPFKALRKKADEELAALELGAEVRALLDRISDYRLRCGRAPLRWDERLEKAATQHSAEMEKLGYFSHVSPVAKYSTLAKRSALVKFKSQWVGENLARGELPAAEILAAFQDSPGHHRNLIFPDYTRVGIAKSGEYWTVNFGGDPE